MTKTIHTDAAPSDVLETTAFLAAIDDFDAMNETDAGSLEASPPAGAAIQAGMLSTGAGVEIEAVAVVE